MCAGFLAQTKKERRAAGGLSLGPALPRPQVKRPAKYGGMQTPSVTYGEYVAKHKPDLFNTSVRAITIAPLYTNNPYRSC